jgi:hypothetical protein
MHDSQDFDTIGQDAIRYNVVGSRDDELAAFGDTSLSTAQRELLKLPNSLSGSADNALGRERTEIA